MGTRCGHPRAQFLGPSLSGYCGINDLARAEVIVKPLIYNNYYAQDFFSSISYIINYHIMFVVLAIQYYKLQFKKLASSGRVG